MNGEEYYLHNEPLYIHGAGMVCGEPQLCNAIGPNFLSSCMSGTYVSKSLRQHMLAM